MDLNPATEGSGPLLQRDYWGVVQNAVLRPPELMRLVAELFTEFPPADLAAFRLNDANRDEGEPEGPQPLDVGDEFDISIFVAGPARVRVLHRDDNSLTLGTLEEHPEAGRITFGAYPNDDGDVVFHIRSRARAASKVAYLEFLAGGEAAQTNTWIDFVDRVAHFAGDGVEGAIQSETTELDEDESPEDMRGPTFVAQGA